MLPLSWQEMYKKRKIDNDRLYKHFQQLEEFILKLSMPPKTNKRYIGIMALLAEVLMFEQWVLIKGKLQLQTRQIPKLYPLWIKFRHHTLIETILQISHTLLTGMTKLAVYLAYYLIHQWKMVGQKNWAHLHRYLKNNLWLQLVIVIFIFTIGFIGLWL